MAQIDTRSQDRNQQRMFKMVAAFGKLEAVHRAYSLASIEMQKILKVPPCIVNCGLCCQNNTPFIWKLEAEYAISTLVGQGTGKLKQATQRAYSWLLDKHRGCWTLGLQNQSADVMFHRVQSEFRTLLSSPCPFWDHKSCSIYDARPISCRAYGITKFVSSKCSRPLGVGELPEMRAMYGNKGARLLQGLVEELWRVISETQWKTIAFSPTLLYSIAQPEKFKALLNDDKIAAAKLVISFPDLSPTQKLENIWNDKSGMTLK